MGELEQIVQRMVDAGESEENIATVIRGYQPTDPRQRMKEDAERLYFGNRNFEQAEGRIPKDSLGTIAKDMATVGATSAALGGGLKLLSKAPMGRIITSAVAGAKQAGPSLPLVGKPIAKFVQGAAKAWQASAPVVAEAAPAAVEAPIAQQAVSAVKPKLSASQVKQMLREHYGSEKGGRMLFGPAREGVTAAGRQALMKEGTSGGALPKAAQRAIDRELAASSADEAFAYAAKAPNAPAQSYIGEMLRKALEARKAGGMHGR